ncbi:MAG: hypothetical protein PHV34_15515 [Verrucomicrobiae bacterium]|nr:hypothetical protein [Verrucomicrobiae bacterium]
MAWACLASNLLVLPGMGTLLAGERRAAYVQMALALAGGALSVVFLYGAVRQWLQTEMIPLDGGPFLREGIIGIGIFLISWSWSLHSGIRLIRRAGSPLPDHSQTPRH